MSITVKTLKLLFTGFKKKKKSKNMVILDAKKFQFHFHRDTPNLKFL